MFRVARTFSQISESVAPSAASSQRRHVWGCQRRSTRGLCATSPKYYIYGWLTSPLSHTLQTGRTSFSASGRRQPSASIWSGWPICCRIDSANVLRRSSLRDPSMTSRRSTAGWLAICSSWHLSVAVDWSACFTATYPEFRKPDSTIRVIVSTVAKEKLSTPSEPSTQRKVSQYPSKLTLHALLHFQRSKNKNSLSAAYNRRHLCLTANHLQRPLASATNATSEHRVS